MNAHELHALETTIASLRSEREGLNDKPMTLADRLAKKRDLSQQILELENTLPSHKARRAIRMTVEPAKLRVRPKRGAIPDTAYLPTSEPRPEQDAVPIPADWQSLDGNVKRALAAKVSDHPITDEASADQEIRAALARRRG